MQIDSIAFEEITTPLPTDWVIRIVIRGSGLQARGMRLVGELGPQPIYNLMPEVGDVTLGFLTRVPTAGDELLIGYADEPLTATGLTFQPPNA